MKIFLSAMAILVLMLTIIDKVRARFGHTQAHPQSYEKWLLIGITFCFILIGLAGHQYYTTKSSGAFTKILIPLLCIIVMADQWRRRK